MLILVIFIILLIIFILNIKTQSKKELFKNNRSYVQKYINDPSNLIKYKLKRDENQQINDDLFNSINKIGINTINSADTNELINKKQCNCKFYVEKIKQLPNKSYKYYIPNNEQYNFNNINFGKKYIKKNLQSNKHQNKSITNNNTTNKKYQTYYDALFTFKPAKKIPNKNNPDIDQTINNNIKDYIDKGIETTENLENSGMVNKKIDKTDMTIKEMYDNITNDNRLELQQNLDDLE